MSVSSRGRNEPTTLEREEVNMRWGFALSVCASFVAGAWVASSLQRRVETVPPPKGGRTATLDAARAVTVSEPRSCGELVSECEHARDFYRAQLVVYEGTPQAWPSDVPDAFRETALADTLRRSFDGLATVNEMDCEEYPCIALVALTSDDPSCCTQIEERLPDPVRQKMGGANMYQTEDGPMAAALAFGAPDQWNADINTRATWRMEQMVEEARSR
jgi:hypothetical protein